MIVGFTIIDTKGNEEAAIQYIQKVCVLESPEIAENIVSAGSGVNVFSRNIVLSELLSQPFKTKPIEVEDGEFLIVSAVNFNVELEYDGNILRLMPTEFTSVKAEDVSHFSRYVHLGLVKVIPDYFGDTSEWVLAKGLWNDSGVWADSNEWKD